MQFKFATDSANDSGLAYHTGPLFSAVTNEVASRFVRTCDRNLNSHIHR